MLFSLPFINLLRVVETLKTFKGFVLITPNILCGKRGGRERQPGRENPSDEIENIDTFWEVKFVILVSFVALRPKYSQ